MARRLTLGMAVEGGDGERVTSQAWELDETGAGVALQPSSELLGEPACK